MVDTRIARMARQIGSQSVPWAEQPDMNVGQIERVGTALLGSALVFGALRRSPLTLLLGLLGGGLLLRALSGRCAVYQRLGMSSAVRSEPSTSEHADLPMALPAEPEPLPRSDDLVDYSSEDSFPASDPPAFNA